MEVAIGKFLRKARRSRDLTQREVSEKMGIKRINYAHYELSGRLQAHLLLHFMSVLNVSVDELGAIISEHQIEEQRRKTREEVNSILNDPTFHNMT